jgi:mono/diheme cytochrome c family protein
MPEIPDFTDAAWERSRTDADLLHSILEGKGKFMRPVKDKLASPDAQRMVAFVRAFQGARGVITAEPVKPATESPPLRSPAVAIESSRPAAGPPPPGPATESQPSRPQVAVASAPAAPAPASIPRVTEAPSALSTSGAATAERTRAATVRYREYCLSCHGIDGRGTEMRSAMPTIPDFTVGAWQDSKDRAELALSILDGKGTLMPAFRERISEDDAQNLVAYIRAFGPRPTRPVESAAPAAPVSDFENRFRRLEGQWDELEKQLRALPPPRAIP